MDNLCESEFADEYQDWLGGHPGAVRAPWFEVPLAQLQCGTPLLVAPETSLRRVITLMNRERRGAALIMREQRLVGIFSERDALQRVLPHQLDLDDTSVSSVMTPLPESLP